VLVIGQSWLTWLIGYLQVVFITGRAHPGEPTGSWMVHGLVDWLLSDDPQAAALLTKVVFKVGPSI